jgi:hypothetical protein
LWGFAKDVAKNENYNVISQSLNECEKIRNRLELIIDSLKNAPVQVIITEGESKSIINNKVLVTPEYLRYFVKIEFKGADGISEEKDGIFSTYRTDFYVKAGDQLYVDKDSVIWVVNVLNINPITLETIKIK